MKDAVPRMRMFAGPNGSGKSTIMDKFKKVKSEELFGVYVNADEIEKQVKDYGYLDIALFDFTTTKEEILPFFANSTFLKDQGLLDDVASLTFEDGRLNFNDIKINSYFASVAADFIRHELLNAKKDFTFETVMSSPDKIDFLKKAKLNGFRTYLYYVATDDPVINISRVKSRVIDGGHAVSEEKIKSRYVRSLNLLLSAIKHTSRAFIFDNSGNHDSWIAEIVDAKDINWKVEKVPYWFAKVIKLVK